VCIDRWILFRSSGCRTAPNQDSEKRNINFKKKTSTTNLLRLPLTLHPTSDFLHVIVGSNKDIV
jgi:hypothetical protein